MQAPALVPDSGFARWRVGSSNTLGEFESGLAAAWLGAVPSLVIGGLG